MRGQAEPRSCVRGLDVMQRPAHRGTVAGVPQPKRIEVEFAGRTLSLSNLDKVLYPAAGFTKGEVIDYYTRIAPGVLPHLRGRPLTLKRYPNGVDGEYFYEKNAPEPPARLGATATIRSARDGRTIDFCLAETWRRWCGWRSSPTWSCTPRSRGRRTPRTPTMVAFDLDPGPPADVVECCRVALRLRELFEHLGLRVLPEDLGLEGPAGLRAAQHAAAYDADEALRAGRRAGARAPQPEPSSREMRKDLREGKVFVDWSQNDEHKTTVARLLAAGAGAPDRLDPAALGGGRGRRGVGRPGRLASRPATCSSAWPSTATCSRRWSSSSRSSRS